MTQPPARGAAETQLSTSAASQAAAPQEFVEGSGSQSGSLVGLGGRSGPYLRFGAGSLGAHRFLEALGPFGLSWVSLGLSWCCLGTVLGSLGLTWGYLGRVLGRSWAALGLSWATPGAKSPKEPKKAPKNGDKFLHLWALFRDLFLDPVRDSKKPVKS